MRYLLLSGAFVILSAVLHAQTRKVQQCVIENGVLKTIDTDYDPSTGNYYLMVSGTRKLFDDLYPSGSKDYAATTAWYINSETIVVNGQKYMKYGLPRVLGIKEIEKAATYDNIGVYVETGTKGTAEVIYIPVRKGCEFQPYQKELEYCQLTVTVSSNLATVSAGKDIVFSATATGAKEKLKYEWVLMEDANADKDGNYRIKGSETGKRIIVSTKGLKKEVEATVLVSIEGSTCYAVEASKLVKVK
jgi:hypothetical protein